MGDFVFYLFGFLTGVPLLLLLSAKTIPEYASHARRLAELFPYRIFAFGVVLGGIGGVASAFLALFYKGIFFPDMPLAARPSEGLTWTLQWAFLNAGLVEEASKCSIGFFLALIVAGNFSERANGGRVFLKATPFICGAVGMGFAMLENFQYIQAGSADTPNPSIILVRTMVSFGHAAVNFNFGLSLLAARPRELPWVAGVAFFWAVIQHGVYDFFAIPSGSFSTFLALAFEVAFLAYVIERMYRILPETRHKEWRPRTAEDDAGQESEGASSSPLEMSATARAFLERGLLRDPHRSLRPPSARTPFVEEEFPFPSREVADCFLKYEYSGPAVDREREYREAFEAACRRAFAGAPAYVWDSSVFAEDLERGEDLYHEMNSLGIDLTRLAPLRVLEFSPSGSLPGAYRYLSVGLAPLMGRELLLSFPYPFALARILFSAFAANAFTRANPMLPLEMFEVVPVQPHLVGDPRGWYRGLLCAPLIDEVREAMERELDGRYPLPLEGLYLSKPDLRFIRRYGAQNYFYILKEMNASWFNDFTRSSLPVEEER
jgi:RsiW-degrading membrane proteinase PrsW (M82 family)